MAVATDALRLDRILAAREQLPSALAFDIGIIGALLGVCLSGVLLLRRSKYARALCMLTLAAQTVAWQTHSFTYEFFVGLWAGIWTAGDAVSPFVGAGFSADVGLGPAVPSVSLNAVPVFLLMLCARTRGHGSTEDVIRG